MVFQNRWRIPFTPMESSSLEALKVIEVKIIPLHYAIQSQAFYDYEVDILDVYIKPFKKYLYGFNVYGPSCGTIVFDLDGSFQLQSLEIMWPRNYWKIVKENQYFSFFQNLISGKVIFRRESFTLGSTTTNIEIEKLDIMTNPQKTNVYIKFSDWDKNRETTTKVKVDENLIMDIKDNQLIGIWVLNIIDDYGGKKLKTWLEDCIHRTRRY